MAERARSWARHYQDEWSERAGDPRLPYWLRVAALAYGCHTANGHARFKRGDIALVLASIDDQGVPVPYAHVGRAITDAVAYGWLEEGSYWGCLIVPSCAIRKGDLHTNPTVCPLAHRHREHGARR